MPGVGLGIGLGYPGHNASAGEELAYDEWLLSLSPIAFFRMADTGTTMVDEVGTITDGTHDAASFVSAPIPTSAGAHSYSGGASSSFTQPAVLASNEYTTLLWVVVDSSVTDYAAMFSGRSPNGPYTSGHALETDGNNFLHAFGTGAGSVDAWAGTLVKGVPVRLALVRDSGGTTRSYLNGVQTDSRASTYVPLPQGTLVELGKRGSELNFAGLIWDVALFDYAWNSATVGEDYLRGTDGLVLPN